MAFDDFKTKESVIVVYTGDGKGKTSASLGMLVRALGSGWKCAYIQFIKHWTVGEHKFLNDISEVYDDKLMFHKGGKGFYNAKDMSAKNVSDDDHRKAAEATFEKAYEYATSGKYRLVVCDEINNAVHDGLLKKSDLEKLIKDKHQATSLCLTGRNFPADLLDKTDIATDMAKMKHHFDDKYLANEGIDY